MSGLLRYLELRAQAKLGLSSGVLISAIVALITAAIAVVFLIFSAFIWLADRYTPLTAALILAGFFLLVAIIAMIITLMSHNRIVQDANVALAARSTQPWLDPKYLSMGLQIGRTVGWRRLVPLIAVGVLTAGLAKEWFGGKPDAGDDDDKDD